MITKAFCTPVNKTRVPVTKVKEPYVNCNINPTSDLQVHSSPCQPLFEILATSPQETGDKKIDFLCLEDDMKGAKDSITMVIREIGFPSIKKIWCKEFCPALSIVYLSLHSRGKIADPLAQFEAIVLYSFIYILKLLSSISCYVHCRVLAW